MDYTAEATVTNTTTYYVEGLDTETDTWIRIASDTAHTAGGGFTDELNAISYAASVRSQGHRVRIVEEIVMRAQRVLPWR